MTDPTRRDLLAFAAAATMLPTVQGADAPRSDTSPEPWGYCFNTATIMGQKLPLAEQVEVAAKAGYQGFEPWLRDIDQFVHEGGSLKDLAKRIRDRGLTVADGIDFPEWIVDDDARRKQALEEAKRSMDRLQQLGSKHIAAPPRGATDRVLREPERAAERYRALLDVGARMGVTPILELWGFSKSVKRLSDALAIAADCGDPKACVLPDVFHLHKGGSPYPGLRVVNGSAIGIFHVNDYPAKPGPAGLTDAHRVYPGDGVAPWKEILTDLRDAGYRGMLSLELFNRAYWKQDALLVAKTGLEKLRAVVRASL